MEIFHPQSRRNFLSSSNDAVSVPTIPLYRSAPTLEVRLEEFESFAIDRLRGLVSSSLLLSSSDSSKLLDLLQIPSLFVSRVSIIYSAYNSVLCSIYAYDY